MQQPPSKAASSQETGPHTFEEMFNLDALRRTWKVLRKELRQTTVRDVVDWVDWSVSVEASLEQIHRDVLEGRYQPAAFTRMESGKSRGAYRVLTALNVKDALVYRHLCDAALNLALPKKVKGAFYSRRHSRTPVGDTFSLEQDAYERFYPVWLRYNEYRTRTLMSGAHEFLVTADISNYFDSVQHDLLFEYLAPLGLPREAVGLLGRLLEAFRPTAGHSARPRVGLPVDELDCSRALAHVFLFEHDSRLLEHFPETDYVRWMDDQNLGVDSEADARRAINILTRSLAQQRLTLNSGKTKFLSPDEVVLHFQLDANEQFNEWDARLKRQHWRLSDELVRDFIDGWQRLETQPSAEKGNWDKILKRAYAFATRADVGILEPRALEDLIRFPFVAERVFTYFARRNRGNELLDLFKAYTMAGENLFEETELRFFESLLFLDADRSLSQRVRHLAHDYVTGNATGQTGRPLGRATALLALYWHGESGRGLIDVCLRESPHLLPREVARSWLACSTALRPSGRAEVIGALFGHSSDDVARLVRLVQELLSGRIKNLGSYKHQRSRWPFPGKYYDARAWLLLDLAAHSPSRQLRNRLRSDLKSFRRLQSTQAEGRVLRRVEKRLNSGKQ